MFCRCFFLALSYINAFLSAVSIDDIESVRKGRQSEGLNKHTDPSVEEMCFSIIFKGSKKNLDLMAANGTEAKQWVSGLDKIIHNMRNLSRQQKSEQYPRPSLSLGHLHTCSSRVSLSAESLISSSIILTS